MDQIISKGFHKEGKTIHNKPANFTICFLQGMLSLFSAPLRYGLYSKVSCSGVSCEMVNVVSYYLIYSTLSYEYSP